MTWSRRKQTLLYEASVNFDGPRRASVAGRWPTGDPGGDEHMWIERYVALGYIPKILFNLPGAPGEKLWADLLTGRYLEREPELVPEVGAVSHTYFALVYQRKRQLPFLQTPYGPQGHEEQFGPRAVIALVKAFRGKSEEFAACIDRGIKALREMESEGSYNRLDAESMAAVPHALMTELAGEGLVPELLA